MGLTGDNYTTRGFIIYTLHGFDPRSDNVRFVVDKAAQVQVFSEYTVLISRIAAFPLIILSSMLCGFDTDSVVQY
jgi:hypothetical protein